MRVLFTGFKGEKNKMSKNDEFINITEENVDTEHLSCIIRSRKPHPGVEAKRCWLKERLKGVWQDDA